MSFGYMKRVTRNTIIVSCWPYLEPMFSFFHIAWAISPIKAFIMGCGIVGIDLLIWACRYTRLSTLCNPLFNFLRNTNLYQVIMNFGYKNGFMIAAGMPFVKPSFYRIQSERLDNILFDHQDKLDDLNAYMCTVMHKLGSNDPVISGAASREIIACVLKLHALTDELTPLTQHVARERFKLDQIWRYAKKNSKL